MPPRAGGLVDFFDLYGGMPQSAMKIVSQVAAEYDAGEVVVVLREAVADSFSYHITAEVRPVPPEEICLLPPMLDGSMEDELGKAGGRRLLAASLYVEGADPDGDQGIEWKTEDDGTPRLCPQWKAHYAGGRRAVLPPCWC